MNKIKYSYRLLLFVLLSTIWQSCIPIFIVEPEEETAKAEQLPSEGKVTLNTLDLDLGYNVLAKAGVDLSQLSLEGFHLAIVNDSSGKQIAYFEDMTKVPFPITLFEGQYTLHVDNGTPTMPAFDAPQLKGQQGFEVGDAVVAIKSIDFEVLNTLLTIDYTPETQAFFDTYEMTASSSDGSLTYTGDEQRVGYFSASPITINVTMTKNGIVKKKTLVLNDVRPGDYNAILVKAINIDTSVDIELTSQGI
ncbi:DUF4493 domain-containing protein [Limibacter armeniacum]|uniref:DUF4493 domain-containing protein n=1 Tax=Limibacter armeniacum TaxID=466084 RepID=UPI002FE66E71